MNYLKFRGRQLFTGYQFEEPGQVLVCKSDGAIENIIPEEEAGGDIQDVEGILCPGFVNSHCHLELSHMKGKIPPSGGMVDFLLSVLQQREAGDMEKQQAVANAEASMIENGIVAVGDICNTIDTIFQKSRKNILYHNFIEVAGFVESTAMDRFNQAIFIKEQFESELEITHTEKGVHSHSISLSPHAPYSVSPKLMELIISSEDNKIISIHNQESAAENEFFQTKTGGFLQLYDSLGIDISFFKPTGQSSLKSFLPCFKTGQSLILVHNVCSSQEDIQFAFNNSGIAKQNISWCICPQANLYINNNLPNISLLQKNQCEIVIGTDSLASNQELNILSELRTIQKNFPAIELSDLLRWATLNGARALNFDHIIGSFETGKRPGILVIGNELETVMRIL